VLDKKRVIKKQLLLRDSRITREGEKDDAERGKGFESRKTEPQTTFAAMVKKGTGKEGASKTVGENASLRGGCGGVGGPKAWGEN